jgi:hypothetical protein
MNNYNKLCGHKTIKLRKFRSGYFCIELQSNMATSASVFISLFGGETDASS